MDSYINIKGCDNFGCAYCAGMGYTDYPNNRKPCPIPGHTKRFQSNFNAVNTYMDSLKRKWSVFDGTCPYCKKEEECEHWNGLGWTKNPKQKKHKNKIIDKDIKVILQAHKEELEKKEKLIDILKTTIEERNRQIRRLKSR